MTAGRVERCRQWLARPLHATPEELAKDLAEFVTCECEAAKRRIDILTQLLRECRPIVRGRHSKLTYGPFGLLKRIDAALDQDELEQEVKKYE